MRLLRALRRRILALTGLTPMSHRPPLPKRFVLYCIAAFIIPIVVIETTPQDVVPYRDLVWLITLVPAYLLSLHFGMKGAAWGLGMGTSVYLAVQLVMAFELEPLDWRLVVPVYASYGVLAIAVGWLSEQLHDFYQRALNAERLAAVGKVAVAIRHEVNNALAAVVAHAQLLEHHVGDLGQEDRQSIQQIIAGAKRVAKAVQTLSTMETAPVTRYVGKTEMIDLQIPSAEPPNEGSAGG